MRAALCIAAALLVPSVAEAGVEQGDRAPELVEVKTAEGKKIQLREHKGKIVVITFGASWCKPCAAQSAAVSRIADQVGDDVRVVGIATSDERGEAEAFVRAHAPRYTAVFDTDSHVGRLLDVRVLPTLGVLDAQGRLVSLERGPLSEPELLRLIERGRQP